MNFAKLLIFLGIGICVLGVVLLAITKLGIPVGKLPGDIHYQGETSSFYFPVVTCLVISLILTIVINLIVWLRSG